MTSPSRFFLAFLFALVSGGMALAQPPAGYYNSAQGLRGEALENALRQIIDGHNSLSYNVAKDRLWASVDVENGLITCIYSGRTSGNLNADTNGMNAEHTWPQSRGAGSTPPRSDLHHLFVTDSTWNSRRGSLRFQNVDNPTAISPIGARVNASEGFEPPDQYKGDVARAIFYFAVRYNREVRNGAFLSGDNNSTADDHMGELDDLVQWHFDDPPSQYEQNRNNRIYSIQGNRNPFIDSPDFVAAWLELESAPGHPLVTARVVPGTPVPGDRVVISAAIVSDEDLDPNTVVAHYETTDGRWGEIPMTLAGGDLRLGEWRAVAGIGDLDPGDSVLYAVSAIDASGRAARDPVIGFHAVTVGEVRVDLDIGGYVLTETHANIVLRFPEGTRVPAGGFVIVGRQATRAEFEARWGAIPGNAIYVNAHEIIGGNGMVINGDEVFTLDNDRGERVDGPTPTASLNARDGRVFRTSTEGNVWIAGNVSGANPGLLEFASTGAGLIITEFSDPENGFREAFVELYYDAPRSSLKSADLMVIY